MRLRTTCKTISAAAAFVPFALLARHPASPICKMCASLLLTSIDVLKSLSVSHDCESVTKLIGARSERGRGVRLTGEGARGAAAHGSGGVVEEPNTALL